MIWNYASYTKYLNYVYNYSNSSTFLDSWILMIEISGDQIAHESERKYMAHILLLIERRCVRSWVIIRVRITLVKIFTVFSVLKYLIILYDPIIYIRKSIVTPLC